MKWLPLLALLACAPAPPCETACGLTLPPARCAEWRDVETRTIYALSNERTGISPTEFCAALDSYRVEVVPAETMPCCHGLRDGDFSIRISDAAPATTLPHELAHVADDTRGISGHETWEARGVWEAIEVAASEPGRSEKCSQSPILTGASGGSL